MILLSMPNNRLSHVCLENISSVGNGGPNKPCVICSTFLAFRSIRFIEKTNSLGFMNAILLHSDLRRVAILCSCSHHPEGGHVWPQYVSCYCGIQLLL
jgi:hypothetical protein